MEINMSNPEHYQRHKDDLDEWEAEPEPRQLRPGATLSTMVSARFTPDEAELLRNAAARAGITLSALVRDSVLEACGRNRVSRDGLRHIELTGSGELRRALVGSAVFARPLVLVRGGVETATGDRPRTAALVTGAI